MTPASIPINVKLISHNMLYAIQCCNYCDGTQEGCRVTGWTTRLGDIYPWSNEAQDIASVPNLGSETMSYASFDHGLGHATMSSLSYNTFQFGYR